MYTSMHSGGFKLTKPTYTRLEDNLIRHRGDRYTQRPLQKTRKGVTFFGHLTLGVQHILRNFWAPGRRSWISTYHPKHGFRTQHSKITFEDNIYTPYSSPETNIIGKITTTTESSTLEGRAQPIRTSEGQKVRNAQKLQLLPLLPWDRLGLSKYQVLVNYQAGFLTVGGFPLLWRRLPSGRPGEEPIRPSTGGAPPCQPSVKFRRGKRYG